MLSQREVANWKLDPVTKEIFKRLRITQEDIMHDWARGYFPTFAQCEKARGIIEGIGILLEIRGDDEQEEG